MKVYVVDSQCTCGIFHSAWLAAEKARVWKDDQGNEIKIAMQGLFGRDAQ